MRYLATVIVTAFVALGAFMGLVLLLTPAPVTAEYWVRELIAIKRQIADENRGTKKLVVASGSSTLFGIDAEYLAHELNSPVINLGLHAALPLEIILQEADYAVDDGDSIVLALEPHYYCQTGMTSWQIRNMIAWQPDSWRALSLPERVSAISRLGPGFLIEVVETQVRLALAPETLSGRLSALDDSLILKKHKMANRSQEFSYSVQNVDRLGNIGNTDGSHFTGVPHSANNSIPVCRESASLLGSYVSKWKQQGITVLFANIPYVRTSTTRIDKVRESSKAFAKDLLPLGTVVDSKDLLLMDRADFFNTDLHLNSSGRYKRTKLLLDSLRTNQVGALTRNPRTTPTLASLE